MRSNPQLRVPAREVERPRKRRWRGARCPRCGAGRAPRDARCAECQKPFCFSHRDPREALWEALPVAAGGDSAHFTVNQLYIAWQGAYSHGAHRALLRAPLLALLGLAAAPLSARVSVLLIPEGAASPLFELLTTLSLLSLGALTPLGWLSRVTLRRWRRRRLCGLFTLGALTALTLRGGLGAWASCAVTGAALILFFSRRLLLSRERFMGTLGRVERRDPEHLKQLIRTPRLQHPPSEWPTEKLYDHGVRQLLIVDQDLTVDLLTRSNFHLEHRVLIFSLQGYPQYMWQLGLRLSTLHPEVRCSLLLRGGHPIEALQALRKRLGLGRQALTLLAWRSGDERALYDHLGFTPVAWREAPVDSVSTPALLEALTAALRRRPARRLRIAGL